VALFLLYFHRALTLAGRARDPFLALLGYGVGFAVVCQALVNMLVITGTIPMTGIPLPFLSYGGTSVVTMLFATGLLMNVGWRARLGREA
jgi:cell division protein FtsW